MRSQLLSSFVCVFSSRLATQHVPPEAISLDDDDTDSFASASFDVLVASLEFPFTFLVAVTQLTGVALTMESMLLVSSGQGTCAMRLMQLLSVQLCEWEWALIRFRLPQSAFHFACLALVARIVDKKNRLSSVRWRASGARECSVG